VTIIQVAVNPYISILGPAKTASVRLNLAQAFNSLGTTLAPLAGAALILSVAVKSANDLAQMSAADVAVYRATQASSVQLPYLLLAGVLAVLAAIMGFSRLPQLKGTEASASLSGLDSALKSRRLVLGTIAIFCYVGAEVAIGSYLINFLGLSDVWAAPEAVAGTFVAFYWGGAMVGRFIGAAIMKTVRPSYVIIFNAGAAAVLVTVAVLSSGSIAGWALIAVGLMNSIMFPTIFTLAIEGLGDKTPQGSAVLCMAIVGGAIIPLMQGLLADRIGLHTSLLLPVVCYIAIAAYGKTVSGGATTQAA
jgi:FHS family L-fucose permease-like MFS transporter